MHELNAPLWTECRQNAKKNAENAQKCTSQKRYQFVAKTVLIPGFGHKQGPLYSFLKLSAHVHVHVHVNMCIFSELRLSLGFLVFRAKPSDFSRRLVLDS